MGSVGVRPLFEWPRPGIGVRNGKLVGVRGSRHDRVNRGRLGPKGLHGWEANLACVSFQTRRQAGWLRTRVDHAAPQALTVPS